MTDAKEWAIVYPDDEERGKIRIQRPNSNPLIKWESIATLHGTPAQQEANARLILAALKALCQNEAACENCGTLRGVKFYDRADVDLCQKCAPELAATSKGE